MASHAKGNMTLPMWRRLAPVAILLLGLALFLLLGLERYVSVDEGIVAALEAANHQGAALIAAHPYSDTDSTPLWAALILILLPL